MNIIKIDPQAKAVETVKSSGTLEHMRQLIDCHMIAVCARQDNGDSLTVDDDSLSLDPQPPAFSFNGSGPIHGIALLTGTDEEGGCAEPTMSVEQALSRINWLGSIYTEPTILVFSF